MSSISHLHGGPAVRWSFLQRLAAALSLAFDSAAHDARVAAEA